MKAITIHQPWASAIALGLKHFETRSWPTAHRGWLLIHAGKQWNKDAVRFQSEAVHHLRAAHGVDNKTVLEFEENPPLGVFVADAWLADCLPTDHLLVSPQEKFFGDFSPGRFAWKFSYVRKFDEPVIWPGAQGIWDTTHYLTRWSKDLDSRRKEAAIASQRP